MRASGRARAARHRTSYVRTVYPYEITHADWALRRTMAHEPSFVGRASVVVVVRVARETGVDAVSVCARVRARSCAFVCSWSREACDALRIANSNPTRVNG